MRMSPAIPCPTARARCPGGAARRDNSGSAAQGNVRNYLPVAATIDWAEQDAARLVQRSRRVSALTAADSTSKPLQPKFIIARRGKKRRRARLSEASLCERPAPCRRRTRRPRFAVIAGSRADSPATRRSSRPSPFAQLFLDQRQSDLLGNVPENRADDQGDHANDKGVLERGRGDRAKLVAC
jgi:hypothetical protein